MTPREFTRRQMHRMAFGAALGTVVPLLRGQGAATRPAGPATSPSDKPLTPMEKAAKLRAERSQLAEGDAFFERGPIPLLKIEIAPADLESLRKDPRKYVKCTWREAMPAGANRVLRDVAVHLKGAAGSFRGVDDRPALTINFEKFSPGRNWRGLEKLHLNNSVQDDTLLSEYLGGCLFRAAGVPAARTSHAKLWINDRDMGFYVLKEGFDDVFLRKFFEKSGGPLYDGGFLRDVDQELAIMSNKAKKNHERMKELAAAARDGDPKVRREKLDRILDIDRFVTLVAMEAMTAHWDGYAFNRNNFRVYDDPKTGKFVFLPHGMDQLFQRPDFPLVGEAGMVARALTSTAEGRDAIMERIETLRKTVLVQPKVDAWLEFATLRLSAVAREFGGKEAEQHHIERARNMRSRVVDRLKHLDTQLAARPKPLKFDRNGVVALEGGWALATAAGEAKLEQVTEGGRTIYRITGSGAINASIRRTVTLPPGKYTLLGQCRAIGVKAETGPNTGVGLRISGGKRTARLVGDSGWTAQTFEFDVATPGDIVLIGEIAAQQGSALFDAGTLKLKK